MQRQNFSDNDEIDLFELFTSIWSGKILIFISTLLSIFIAGYYITNTDKKYTAKAVFEIENNDNSGGLNLTSELGALASISGFGTNLNSGNELLIERIKGREFITEASYNLALMEDPFFNDYDPDKIDHLWKKVVKKLIGWQPLTQKAEIIIEDTILNNFLENVTASITEAGAVEIAVIHKKPEIAARYANSLMEQVRKLIQKEEDKSKEFRLTYLAETLADALQDMENAQTKLKDFALQNSTAAPENFIAGSLKLDTLRIERDEAQEFINTLDELRKLVELGQLNDGQYNYLRTKSPLVDDINFRRVLGMSETISAWTWPSLETIKNVNYTLKDRVTRLQIEIADIEENAKQYASSAEDLAKLTREVKIAEATFTVLTEQVKSQSLVAGYKPDTFKVFSYASIPLLPSSPQRNIVLSVGAILGFLIGCLASLVLAKKRGVFNTRSSLIFKANPMISINTKSLRRLSSLNMSKLLIKLRKTKNEELRQAEVALSSKKLVYFLNMGGKPSASQMARLIAVQSSRSGRNVLVCDTINVTSYSSKERPLNDLSGFSVHGSEGGFDTVDDAIAETFFTSSNFEKHLKTMISRYDQVFICSDQKKSSAELIALQSFDPSTVLTARLRKTKKGSIQNIRSNNPISILFHD